MYTSKFKLILHWLAIGLGFYVFWAFSYLILAKFAISQVNRFQYTKQSIWLEITASDVFWYILFILGMALVTYIISLLIKYAPNRKIAAFLFAILIVASAGVLLDKLLETSSIFNVLPHVFINLVFLISIIYISLKRKVPVVANEEDFPEDAE